MKESDLIIRERNGAYRVQVSGRANFEYAPPLRNLAKNLTDFTSFIIDMANCTAMDSTFMGVLAMLAVKGKSCNVRLELRNASEVLQKLLRDLGIAKLFDFTTGEVDGVENFDRKENTEKADTLSVANAVVDAHETLAEVDSENAKRFADVINYAKADVERLKSANQENKN